MEVKASAKKIRLSPRKVRLVIDLVRGAKVNDALDQLMFVNKGPKNTVVKLIKSAVANAVNTYDLSEDNLFIKEIRVDEGVTLKRWMPRARGRATPVRKRTSHIMLVLGEVKDSGDVKAKKQEIEAPVSLQNKVDEAKKVETKKPKTKDKVNAKGREGGLGHEKKEEQEKGKKIVDSRSEGKGKNTKIEAKSTKSFGGKMFRRKSG